MKKIWRNNDGVSPVIATILMVAITVVLAAVLYVMVMGGIDIDGIDLRGGQISDVNYRSNSSVEVVFGEFTGEAHPTDVQFLLEKGDGHRITLGWPAIPDSDNYVMSTSDSDVSAFYRDFRPASNSIDNGDSIIVNGLTPGEHYLIKLVTLDGSAIEMTGQTSFTLAN